MHELKILQWRELLRSLTLPVLLLLAQQGALLHEVSHWTAAHEHSQKQSPGEEVCVLCLSFAQLDSAAAPQPVTAPLNADLSYSFLPSPPAVAGAVELPAERSRGPPLFL